MISPNRSRRDDLAAIGELAEGQEGYFSSAQAGSVGIDRHRLQRMAAGGILERDEYGIYRFAVYPHGDRGELWRAVLWPSVKRGDLVGILSYSTALSLHEISTINPSTIDLSLPEGLRFRRAVPSKYRVRFQDIHENEITRIHSLPVTTLFRTLLDLIISGEERQFVAEALENAPKRGVLTAEELRRLQALNAVGPTLIHKVADIVRKS
jgi:predicted transcriptional regulator of viral defense system